MSLFHARLTKFAFFPPMINKICRFLCQINDTILNWFWQNLYFLIAANWWHSWFFSWMKHMIIPQQINKIINFFAHHRQNSWFFHALSMKFVIFSCLFDKFCDFFHAWSTKFAIFWNLIGKTRDSSMSDWQYFLFFCIWSTKYLFFPWNK